MCIRDSGKVFIGESMFSRVPSASKIALIFLARYLQEHEMCIRDRGTVVFDKTGTLTHGEFAVAAVHADDFCPDHASHDADNVHLSLIHI